MASRRLQVMCINRRPNRVDPHGHIYAIGGVDGGVRWKHSEEDAIRFIEQGLIDYFVNVNNRPVAVHVAVHLGHKYLKTVADSYTPNNLLSLPECPPI
jgi:hypothetical protein